MYSYIIGTISEVMNNYITLENNGVGYQIYTSNPYKFNLDEKYKVYIYQHVKEDEMTLYGFKELEEKIMFLKLIGVKGLGCKMALPMLATGSISGIVDAIERENILYLKKFPKIGDKVARQIVLDLKGKLVPKYDEKIKDVEFEELIEVLKGLGYKPSDITRILPKISKNNNIEDQIKEALRLFLK